MGASEERQEENRSGSVTQLAADLATLVRHEVELAKSELAEKAKSAGVGAGMLSGSAVAALVTVGCLTALAIVALALVIPLWAAVLVITAFWAGVTAVLALAGKRKVEAAIPFTPEQTIENLKEDVEWARRGAKQLRT